VLASALCGLLLSLSLPPVDAWPVAFVALAPVFWLLRGSQLLRGLAIGLALGVGYFGAVLYWILLFGELAWGALVIWSASYVGLFGLAATTIVRPGRPWRSSLGLAALWVAVEWVHGMWPLGGFTWGQLGSTQTGNPLLLPLASVGGVWALSFVVALVNALLVVAWERSSGGVLAALPPIGLGLVLAVVPVLIPLPAPDGPSLDVAAIQVDVRAAYGPDRLAEDRTVAEMNVDLHGTLAADPPDLVVWGESALDPGAFEPDTFERVTEAIRELGVPTLVGGVPRGPDGKLRNEGLLFDDEGNLVDRYAKTHLVPYGEYIPLKWLVGWVSALDQVPYELTPGERLATLEVDGLVIANVICFENSFPSIDRELVNQGADLLVVTTNNSSYEETAASQQQLVFSRLRAVELGRWTVHAALSGVSAMIDPSGRVVERSELFEPAILRHQIRLSQARTLYSRLGDWVPLLCMPFVLFLFLYPPPRPHERAPLRFTPDPRVLVVLPTYDERQTIESVLRALRSLPDPVDVLVVDDGSPDGTGDVVRSMAQNDPGVRLIERRAKQGLASAYLLGFRQALEDGYDVVAEMDADLSHDPQQLPSLLAALGRADLVIGSRYVPGGSVTNWSRSRLLLSRAGNVYARLTLGLPAGDLTSGFRVYRRRTLERILTRPVRSDGYAFQIELTLRTWLLGATIAQVPITFRERQHGRSKISRGVVAEALWLTTVWGLRLRLGGSPWRPTQRP